MNSIFGRFLLSLGNVFSSLIIGALALAIVWIYIPSLALRLFRWAASVRDWIVLANWPPQYEVPLRFFVDERQIVYVGFVLASRIVVGPADHPGRQGTGSQAAARVPDLSITGRSFGWLTNTLVSRFESPPDRNC